jgi:hypothetical protein
MIEPPKFAQQLPKRINVRLPEIPCQFCGTLTEKTSNEKRSYTFPDDNCCAARTLWLLGVLSRNRNDMQSAGKEVDAGLLQDIPRLANLLRRRDMADLQQAREQVIKYNRTSQFYFNVDAILVSLGRVRSQP